MASLYAHFIDEWQEAHSGVVDLQYHDDPMHVRAMLRHFYGLPYDQMVDSEPSTTKTHRDLVFHAAVFTLADYYDVPCLRIAVVATFERNFKLCVLWNSKDFLDSIESAFKDHEGRADKRLQETIVKLCLEHLEDLVKKDDFLPLLEKVGPLSASLLKETWKNVENRHVMVCIACSKTRDSCCDVGCGQEDFESVQITFMGN